ncbi:MAG: hypothetical protein IJF08_07585, partial [Clostridia bacterium]|nr:hypothetical protein [Clostridia bacterium]
ATACRQIQQTDGDMALPPPQIPITERTEDFLAVELTQEPADFIGQSDQFIYATLKAALAEAHCLEEDERYVFWLHWDNKLYNSKKAGDTVTDTYRISYHLDSDSWMETHELLHLTFSVAGALLAATYESKETEYFLSGDVPYVAEIYSPDDAEEFPQEDALLTGMDGFLMRNKATEQDARKFIRARWNEYYTHSRNETDYYAMKDGFSITEDDQGNTKIEEYSRYLALTFAEDGTLTAAVITQEP